MKMEERIGELENERRELVINAVENLRERINGVVKRVPAKQKLRGVKEELEPVRSLAEELEAVASTITDPLRETVENPERIEAEFGTDVLAGVYEGFSGLISSL